MKSAMFERMISPLKHRVAMMVARAVVTLVDDARGLQALQLSGLADELLEGAERMQDYGFTSHPHPGAEAVVVFPGGLRSHPLIVALGDRRHRLKDLQPGEVAIYDDQGQVVVLGRDGVRLESPLRVEIVAPEVAVTAETSVRIEAPSILLKGDVDLGDEGGKLIARHDDAVVAGKVVATTSKVRSI